MAVDLGAALRKAPYPGFAYTTVIESTMRTFDTHITRLFVINFSEQISQLTVQSELIIFNAIYEQQISDIYVTVTPFVAVGRFQGNLLQLDDILQNIVYLSSGDVEVDLSPYTTTNIIRLNDKLSIVVFDDSLVQKALPPAVVYVPLVVTLPPNIPYISSSYCEGICDAGDNGAVYMYEDSVVLMGGLTTSIGGVTGPGQGPPSLGQRYPS